MYNVFCNVLFYSVVIYDILIFDYMRIWCIIFVVCIFMRILILGVFLFNKIVFLMGL